MSELALRIKAHCPKCGPDRFAMVHFELARNWSVDFMGDPQSPLLVHFSDAYRLLVCNGCDTRFCQRIKSCSEDYDPLDKDDGAEVTYWPSAVLKKKPDWISELIFKDRILADLLDEIYSAANNDLRCLAAIGVRSVFERSAELLGIGNSLSYACKLNELVHREFLARKEVKLLEVLIDGGNAAVHRAWRPSAKNLVQMLLVMESFLQSQFVNNLEAVKQTIPPRPK